MRRDSGVAAFPRTRARPGARWAAARLGRLRAGERRRTVDRSRRRSTRGLPPDGAETDGQVREPDRAPAPPSRSRRPAPGPPSGEIRLVARFSREVLPARGA